MSLRAEPSQEQTSVDVLVCHGNVIRYFMMMMKMMTMKMIMVRYFVCRALQFDPQGWLRMAVHNGELCIIPK